MRVRTVAEAQQHNAAKMTDESLRRELHRVTGYPEQPQIRRDWVRVLRAEIQRREALAAGGGKP